MNNSKNGFDTTEHKAEGELVQNQPSADAEALAGLVRSISEPIAEAQTIAAKEATKQNEIAAKTNKTVFLGLVAVALSVVLVSVLALYEGQTQLKEKILMALVGFMGGFGVGKVTSRT
ncbi:MAG: hypothetical protein JAY63_18495 [Candidatus Thiodiazotropha taylori]|nr:hypothetical protein [Candidatus Thiodiazotropha taylori]